MNWYKKSFNLKNVFKGMATTMGLSIPFMLIMLNMSNQDFLNLWNKHDGDEQAVTQALKQELNRKAQFDYKAFANKIRQYEGYEPKVYDDGRGNNTIGIGHMITPESRQIFQQLFGKAVDFNAVASGKQTLTDQQIQRLAQYDIDKHLTRARRIFPKYDTYPYYVQEALLNSVYRGDTGKKTAVLINQGKWEEAAAEYLNRHDYVNAVKLGIPGIRTRMESNRDAMLQYSKDLKQQTK